jgi:indole-3-glycerol phosphate synthase
MTDFLQQMADLSAERAAGAKQAFSAKQLDKPVFPVKLQGFDIIAEIKDRSPSEGSLSSPARSRTQQAEDYIHGGAAAISVLTEPSRFAGELEHLEEVSAVAASFGIPTMRKDFLVDPSQVLEARAAGASGVLLIAAMLSDKTLNAMLDCAWEHSMFVLLESFDETDLSRTSSLLESDRHSSKAEQAEFFAGVNSRNLRTLQVDPERLRDLASMLPAKMVSVAESGLQNTAQVKSAAAMGYRMALVGTAFMRSAQPRTLLSDMLTAGRGM